MDSEEARYVLGRRTRAFVFGNGGQSWARRGGLAGGERWAGLPAGAVLMGSFVEAVEWRTRRRGAAQEGTRAARERK